MLKEHPFIERTARRTRESVGGRSSPAPKRMLSILLISILFLSGLSGYEHNIVARDREIPNSPLRDLSFIRATTSGNGSGGVVWSDEFKDESGILVRENVTVENGSAGVSYDYISPDESTVGLWHFEEGGGMEVTDSGPYGNDGTIRGGDRNQGVMGRGLGFDGDNARVEFGGAGNFNVTENITLEAWMRSDTHGWKFKRPITIDPATTVEDQQIKVELDTEAFNYSSCRPDGGDLRFYNGQMEPLTYWMEKWDRTGPSTIWVKIPDMGTSRISMYYGNPLAESASDMSETMVFSDDFPEDRGRFYGDDYPNWTVREGSWVIEDGILKNYYGSDHIAINDTDVSGPGLVLRAKVRENANWKHPHMLIAWQDMDNYYLLDLSGGNHRASLHKRVNGNSTLLFEAQHPSIDIGQWYVCEMAWVSSSSMEGRIWDAEGRLLVSFSTSIPEGWTAGSYGFGGSRGVSATWFDNVTVRKIVEPEPEIIIWNETPTGISGSGSYGLGSNETRAFGTINGRTISAPVPPGWNHLALTYDGSELALYVNGDPVVTEPHSGKISRDSVPLLIGDMFDGSVDEVCIYNRTLTPWEIAEHAGIYRRNGSLSSEIVTLPPGMLWGKARFAADVPVNTSLLISVLDADTDSGPNGTEIFNTTAVGDGAIDLSSLNPLKYGSILISAEFVSDGGNTPVLYNWSITSDPPKPPAVIKEPGTVSLPEDTLNGSVLDLSEFFYDPYSAFQAPTYRLDYDRDNGNIVLSVNDSRLRIEFLSDNWTGNLSVVASCTNMFGLTDRTEPFELKVTNVNDPPVVKLFSPRDGTTLKIEDIRLFWKGYDVDDKPADLLFDLYLGTSETPPLHTSDIKKEGFSLTDLENGETYYWYVTAKDGRAAGTCVSGIWSFSVDTSGTIPGVVLLAPPDGSSVKSGEAELKWKPSGSYKGNVTYLILLGTTETDLYEIDTTRDTTYVPGDLEPNTSYYWQVIPRVNTDRGICLSGVWRFTTFRPSDRELKVETDISELRMYPGGQRAFVITLTNNGTQALRINITSDGPLADDLAVVNDVVLHAGRAGQLRLEAVLRLPADIEAGEYPLEIRFSHGAGKENLVVPVTVLEKREKVEPGEENGEKEGKEDDDGEEKVEGSEERVWLWTMLIFSTVLSLLAVILLVIFRKKGGPGEGGKNLGGKGESYNNVRSKERPPGTRSPRASTSRQR